MSNKYLEKIAENRLAKHIRSKGLGVDNVTGKAMSNAQITAAHDYGTAGKGHTQGYNTTRKVQTAGKDGSMLSGLRTASNPIKPVHTTDVLADSKNNLQQRLINRKANIAQGRVPSGPVKSVFTGKLANTPKIAKAAPSSGGIFSKAIGLAKKHPLIAGGAALGTAAFALGRSSKQSAPPGYA